MTLILIIVLIVLLLGGGYGWHTGYVGPAAGNPLGIILVVLIILLLLGVIGGPRFGWW